MIYLIGGVARTGKTMLARRLLQEHGMPCFCIDYLVSGLQQGASELGIVGESRNRLRAPRLWPILEGMLRNIVEVEPAYTVEGDVLWPRGVAALTQAYAGQVRACFLGYAAIAPERKAQEIRRFGGGVNDWIQDHTDAYILDLVVEMIGFSRFVQSECAAVGVPYLDMSDDFAATLARAYAALTA